jgi:hypothetical protein
VCGRQPRPFHRSRATVPEASRPAAHPGRTAGLAKTVLRRASRHQTIRPVAEPRTGRHEVLALRLGLKSEDAASSFVSPTSGRFHDTIFSAP